LVTRKAGAMPEILFNKLAFDHNLANVFALLVGAESRPIFACYMGGLQTMVYLIIS